MLTRILSLLENASNVIWADAGSDVQLPENGSRLEPYRTLNPTTGAISALTTTRRTIIAMPGTYTETASLALPTTFGCNIIGLGGMGTVRVDAAVGVSPLVDIVPATAAASDTFDYILQNIYVANVEAAQIGIQIDNTSASNKTILDMFRCPIEDGAASGAALDVDHDGSETIRVYADKCEIEGAINFDVGNPQDRFFIQDSEVMGLLTAAGDNVNAHFRYMRCIVLADTCATNGTTTTQRFTAINCTSRTVTTDDSSETYAAFDTSDVGSGAKFAETIIG